MFDEDKYQVMATKAFAAAGLPEVDERQLEVGTYTNAQIAEKMRNHPLELVSMLMKVSNLGGSAEKRSILSFMIEIFEGNQKKGG